MNHVYMWRLNQQSLLHLKKNQSMEQVIYSCADRIGTITLNRPEKRNALGSEMVNELKSAFRAQIADKNCKVIVLKALGPAFCAGADLQYLQDLQHYSNEENLADSQSLKELFELIHMAPKVVIAQIEGHALAGGCGIATVCDFSFAVPDAKFGYTEVKIGFIPALVMVFLIRKIGEGKSRSLLLTGDVISAREAAQIGLINQVCEPGEIATEVEKLARKLIDQTSGNSLALVKKMIHEVQHLSLKAGLNYAAEENAKARAHDDCKKGIASFLNKSPLTW